MNPVLSSDPYGVTLVGEALGEVEAEASTPFVGPAGFKLTRLIEWAGLDRGRFDIINTVWCRPPENRLEGTPYEHAAIDHCRKAHWEHLLSRSHVLVPLGNVPTRALLGAGPGILKRRGYVDQLPGMPQLVLPSIHPSFIQRGQSKYSAAVIHDLQRSVELASDLALNRYVAQPREYLLDPSPREALAWATTAVERCGGGAFRLAFDIETPGKGDEEEAEYDDDLASDPTYRIERIGFAYEPFRAMSIPWSPEYFAAIRLLTEADIEKVVWNGGFDCPRLAAAGFPVRGLVHDGMVAWHVLHSDLPKGLGFVATFTCPDQHEWKSMSGSAPALYNAIDADVEARSMDVIERELRENGLWDVYERDVVELDPILVRMSDAGMPIDAQRRLEFALKLESEKASTQASMQASVPLSALSISPKEGYKKAPKGAETDPGMITIEVETITTYCSICGLENPKKTHFKEIKRPTAKKPQNKCLKGETHWKTAVVKRYARVVPFVPSRTMLLRYQSALDRPIPQVYDKKSGTKRPTMNEKAIKGLMKKYPDDPLYPLVLKYRELEKIAGTYIGKPEGE